MFLKQGQWYRVIQAFVDADGDAHSVGEEWLILGTMICNYDSEVIFAVANESGDELLLPFRDGKNDVVLSNIDVFFERTHHAC
jgi:hypothetical protein